MAGNLMQYLQANNPNLMNQAGALQLFSQYNPGLDPASLIAKYQALGPAQPQSQSDVGTWVPNYGAGGISGGGGGSSNAPVAGSPVSPATQSGMTGTVMPSTLGTMASGQMPTGSNTTFPSGGIPLPNTNNGFALNPAAYQNPMAQYMQGWANKALQGTYAGAGDLLSGPAMQGITQFNQNAALNNSYLPALNAAQQQQGTGIGLGEYNQQFGYNQALNNQTIPFQQQMQLANLGLQGAGGQQSVTNLLASLLSQNALGAGTAAGTGTVGAGNSISSAISQMLSNYLQQSLLNRIPALNQQPTGTGQ